MRPRRKKTRNTCSPSVHHKSPPGIPILAPENGKVGLKNGKVGLKNAEVGLKNGKVGLKNGKIGFKNAVFWRKTPKSESKTEKSDSRTGKLDSKTPFSRPKMAMAGCKIIQNPNKMRDLGRKWAFGPFFMPRFVAADVNPLIIPAGEKFEPTHVGCHGIPNDGNQMGALSALPAAAKQPAAA